MDLGPWAIRGLTLALALVVGAVTWMVSEDGGSDAVTPASGIEARIVDAAQLADAAALAGHPVYWAGTIAGTELELSESGEGGIQVRYLGEGAEAGDESAGVLNVASYPLSDPTGALRAFAEKRGSTVRRSRDGREVVVNRANPTSAYFASPDNSVQVEVYDPSPQRALALALSDRVRPAE